MTKIDVSVHDHNAGTPSQQISRKRQTAIATPIAICAVHNTAPYLSGNSLTVSPDSEIVGWRLHMEIPQAPKKISPHQCGIDHLPEGSYGAGVETKARDEIGKPGNGEDR